MNVIRSRLPLVVVGLGLACLLPDAWGAPLKIACVGDSITEGAGLSNPGLEAYPSKLQRLLGTNYVVRNYGVSGRTLLKKGDFPYWKEAAYRQSHDWAPDVVIIKLGTNDSKPYNWRYGTNFVSDFEELVASYVALAGPRRIFLCAPAPVFARGAFDISPSVVADEIAPAIRTLAARLGVSLIDFHERLSGHAEWFPDTVHPNSKGTTVIAAIAFDALQDPATTHSEPVLGVAPIGGRRLRLDWPADLGGMVLQSFSALGSGAPVTAIVEQLASTDGEHLRVTNTMTLGSVPRFYRLWRP